MQGCLWEASPGHPRGSLNQVWWPPGRNPRKYCFLCWETIFPSLYTRLSKLESLKQVSAIRSWESQVTLLTRGSVPLLWAGMAVTLGGTRATSPLPRWLWNKPFGTLKCKREELGQTGGFLETSGASRCGRVQEMPNPRRVLEASGSDPGSQALEEGEMACTGRWADGLNTHL